MSDMALGHEHPHHHHPFLQHHFEDLGQQHEASTLGMWMFLCTEILFFGGVLCAYWIYRYLYPEAWAVAAHQQNTLYGGINTIDHPLLALVHVVHHDYFSKLRIRPFQLHHEFRNHAHQAAAFLHHAVGQAFH